MYHPKAKKWSVDIGQRHPLFPNIRSHSCANIEVVNFNSKTVPHSSIMRAVTIHTIFVSISIRCGITFAMKIRKKATNGTFRFLSYFLIRNDSFDFACIIIIWRSCVRTCVPSMCVYVCSGARRECIVCNVMVSHGIEMYVHNTLDTLVPSKST